MAQNKTLNVQPIPLIATLTTNLLNCGVTSMAGPVGVVVGQPYIIIRKIKVINKTATAQNFSLWKGATGGNVAGTELFIGMNVAANSMFVDYGIFRLDAADFLVGGASLVASLILTVDGEIGVSG